MRPPEVLLCSISLVYLPFTSQQQQAVLTDFLNDDYIMVHDKVRKLGVQVGLQESADGVTTNVLTGQIYEDAEAMCLHPATGQMAYQSSKTNSIIYGLNSVPFEEKVTHMEIDPCGGNLFWNTDTGLYKWDMKGRSYQTLLSAPTPQSKILSITLDFKRSQVYWTQTNASSSQKGEVWRMHSDGSSMQMVLETKTTLYALAVDYEMYMLNVMSETGRMLYMMPLDLMETLTNHAPPVHLDYETNPEFKTGTIISDILSYHGRIYYVDPESGSILRFDLVLGVSSTEQYGQVSISRRNSMSFYSSRHYDRNIVSIRRCGMPSSQFLRQQNPITPIEQSTASAPHLSHEMSTKRAPVFDSDTDSFRAEQGMLFGSLRLQTTPSPGRGNEFSSESILPTYDSDLTETNLPIQTTAQSIYNQDSTDVKIYNNDTTANGVSQTIGYSSTRSPGETPDRRYAVSSEKNSLKAEHNDTVVTDSISVTTTARLNSNGLLNTATTNRFDEISSESMWLEPHVTDDTVEESTQPDDFGPVSLVTTEAPNRLDGISSESMWFLGTDVNGNSVEDSTQPDDFSPILLTATESPNRLDEISSESTRYIGTNVNDNTVEESTQSHDSIPASFVTTEAPNRLEERSSESMWLATNVTDNIVEESIELVEFNPSSLETTEAPNHLDEISSESMRPATTVVTFQTKPLNSDEINGSISTKQTSDAKHIQSTTSISPESSSGADLVTMSPAHDTSKAPQSRDTSSHNLDLDHPCFLILSTSGKEKRLVEEAFRNCLAVAMYFPSKDLE